MLLEYGDNLDILSFFNYISTRTQYSIYDLYQYKFILLVQNQ
jgi:hypothetical protein